ncbi:MULTISPECIES: type II toxin-antitoxin system RelE/ParE family toxin [Burkholderia]|uniref:type II toxin-antitoxin system RelE/ParE family toxin n=1 Tax=Burkholderia TaxID=32008 RepID=UPI0007546577|nr:MULTISPECIES: type II toxin-antitoxin system RelE/ParE family toxin [Burkholderia]KVE37254.1 plasmid stabilization protein [Burkholderia sp. TSV86]MDN7664072.1 type II toxin-antitoxin system RelE/ParE family toxin [Burkholderia cenocepacia]
MPRIIITLSAARGLERCRRFLEEKAPDAAKRAAQTIKQHLLTLERSPDIGRPLDESPELRELIIPFGGAGYVARYRYDRGENTVYVLAFRHQREAGY